MEIYIYNKDKIIKKFDNVSDAREYMLKNGNPNWRIFKRLGAFWVRDVLIMNWEQAKNFYGKNDCNKKVLGGD